jgi:hypothetical protein
MVKALQVAGRPALTIPASLLSCSTWRKNPLVGVKINGKVALFRESLREVADDLTTTHAYAGAQGAKKYAKYYANAALGPKTLARLIESALTAPGFCVTSTKSMNVTSGYANNAVIKLERKGRYLYFTAPCGRGGRVTIKTAQQLVVELRLL